MDLIKALFIGAALVAGVFAITALIAVLTPIMGFVIIVLLVFFVMKVLEHDRKDPDG